MHLWIFSSPLQFLMWRQTAKWSTYPTLHSCNNIEYSASLEVMSEICAMRTTAEQSRIQDSGGKIYDDYRETTCTFFKRIIFLHYNQTVGIPLFFLRLFFKYWGREQNILGLKKLSRTIKRSDQGLQPCLQAAATHQESSQHLPLWP